MPLFVSKQHQLCAIWGPGCSTYTLPYVIDGAYDRWFLCCRNARRDSMKQLDKHEKDGDLSEDEKKALADSIQELTDDYVKQIEKLAKTKQDELVKI